MPYGRFCYITRIGEYSTVPIGVISGLMPVVLGFVYINIERLVQFFSPFSYAMVAVAILNWLPVYGNQYLVSGTQRVFLLLCGPHDYIVSKRFNLYEILRQLACVSHSGI